MKKKVNISLDEEIAKKLKALAEGSRRTVSQWITDKVMEADITPVKEQMKGGEE